MTEDNKELAERWANQDATRAGAEDEIIAAMDVAEGGCEICGTTTDLHYDELCFK